MKGIGCRECGRAQVIPDEWLASLSTAFHVPSTEDLIEAMLPKLTCKNCGARHLQLLNMEVLPTGPERPSGRVCVDCGEFLTVARVDAMPDALRCVDCQSAVDAGGASPEPPAPPSDPADRALFEALRAWRREAATAAGIPAYCVLHDKTLRAVSEIRPRSLSSLKAIPGFGPQKLEKYGPAVVEIVVEFGDSR